MQGILSGLRIVEGTAFVAAPSLGFDALRAGREDLVMVNLTGRRDGGSEVDYTVNPQVGIPFLTGPEGRAVPVNHVLPAWDFISGQMMALSILAAERHRRLTGRGQLVKIALKDVALAVLGHFGMIAEVMINDEDRPKYGNYLYGAFGRDFETMDGRSLMVVGLTALQWKCPCRATGLDAEFNAIGGRLNLDMKDESTTPSSSPAAPATHRENEAVLNNGNKGNEGPGGDPSEAAWNGTLAFGAA